MLVFTDEDNTGVKHESNKFKQDDLVLWNLDVSVHLWRNHSRWLINFAQVRQGSQQVYINYLAIQRSFQNKNR